MKRSDIEIMAPAGSYESLHAAIDAGANSVYFGVGRLNMRAQSAANFTLEDMGQIVSIAREHGVKSYLTVNTVIYDEEIETLHATIDRACEVGVDAIIAEGTESGGHVGEMTTMALVPQVIDAVSVPVVAAGGIADGRQAAAAFALGACGIQVGTCLLASEECPIHPNYKQAVLKAKDSDTVVTGRSIGGPVRILKNKMAREYLALEKRGASLEELEKVTLGGLRRAVLEGDVEMGSVMSGQVAGMLHEIRPVAEIFRDLYESGIARAKATAAEWSDAE